MNYMGGQFMVLLRKKTQYRDRLKKKTVDEWSPYTIPHFCDVHLGNTATFCSSVLGSDQQLANGAGLPCSAFADFHSVNILIKEKILFMASIIECRAGGSECISESSHSIPLMQTHQMQISSKEQEVVKPCNSK